MNQVYQRRWCCSSLSNNWETLSSQIQNELLKVFWYHPKVWLQKREWEFICPIDGYIKEALQKFVHLFPKQHHYGPGKHINIKYGAKVLYATTICQMIPINLSHSNITQRRKNNNKLYMNIKQGNITLIFIMNNLMFNSFRHHP